MVRSERLTQALSIIDKPELAPQVIEAVRGGRAGQGDKPREEIGELG